jgi:hypothetical protein
MYADLAQIQANRISGPYAFSESAVVMPVIGSLHLDLALLAEVGRER